ncbi:MAG: type III-B CRISPR-associated protein Cas10/Cmr2 [Pseudomonadota bacterium]
MKKKYLVLFQFGPVQDFIHTARRTDDYWAGSFLLSYTTAQIICELKKQKSKIVFPNPGDNALVKAVCENNFNNEEALQPSLNEEALQPSLPNRVAAIIEEEEHSQLKERLNELRGDVVKKIVSRFEEVEKSLTGRSLVAKKQVEDLFEFFYAFAEYDKIGHKYGLILKTVEKNLAARKNIRDFTHFYQYGFKCTQCGVREPLRDNHSLEENSDLQGLRDYWKKLLRDKYKYAFRDNERLCSVCAGKRLLRRVCFKRGAIPSTSTIAVSVWLDQIQDKLDFSDVNQSNNINTFIYNLKQANLIQQSASVPGNAGKTHPLFQIEGDCFISDSYDRFEKEAEHKEVNYVRMAKDGLAKMLKELPDPPKYYTILSLDGDFIGKYCRSLEGLEEHQDFSKKLAGFTKIVYRIVHKEYHGYVIYFGGDEGIILLPLAETLEVMNKLRKEFSHITGGLTLSAGAAIVHHQFPLGQGLKAAKEAINMAKTVRGKNAFSFNIRKRSGANIICAAPWEVKRESNQQEVIKFLKAWLDAYSNGLSVRWYYQFANMEPVMEDERGMYDIGMVINELYRVLPRHLQDKAIAFSLINKTKDIIYGHRELVEFKNLLSLLYVPIYIYQGGQD